MQIRYGNFKNLKDEELTAKSSFERECMKIERDFKADSMIVNVKLHDKEGGRKKYSFRAVVEGPSILFESHAFDWDLQRAIHKTVNKLVNEGKKKFKTEGKPRRTGKKGE